MDILELFTVIFTTLAGLVALHVAAFLTVRWMYPPQVAPAPQSAPQSVQAPVVFTVPAQPVNAPKDEITLPMAPPSEEGATTLESLTGSTPI